MTEMKGTKCLPVSSKYGHSEGMTAVMIVFNIPVLMVKLICPSNKTFADPVPARSKA